MVSNGSGCQRTTLGSRVMVVVTTLGSHVVDVHALVLVGVCVEEREG